MSITYALLTTLAPVAASALLTLLVLKLHKRLSRPQPWRWCEECASWHRRGATGRPEWLGAGKLMLGEAIESEGRAPVECPACKAMRRVMRKKEVEIL